MKLCSFSTNDAASYGIVTDNGIVDLGRRFPEATLRDFLADGLGRAAALADAPHAGGAETLSFVPAFLENDRIGFRHVERFVIHISVCGTSHLSGRPAAMGCWGSSVVTWLGAPSPRYAGKMQPGRVSCHTPFSWRNEGVSGASRLGTLPSGFSLAYANFAVARSRISFAKFQFQDGLTLSDTATGWGRVSSSSPGPCFCAPAWCGFCSHRGPAPRRGPHGPGLNAPIGRRVAAKEGGTTARPGRRVQPADEQTRRPQWRATQPSTRSARFPDAGAKPDASGMVQSPLGQ